MDCVKARCIVKTVKVKCRRDMSVKPENKKTCFYGAKGKSNTFLLQECELCHKVGVGYIKNLDVIKKRLNISEEQPKEEVHKGQIHGAPKDLGLFSNTVMKAADLLRQSGLTVDCEQRTGETGMDIAIRIRKSITNT